MTKVTMTEPKYGASPFNPNRPLLQWGSGSSFGPYQYGMPYTMMVRLQWNPSTYTENIVAAGNQGSYVPGGRPSGNGYVPQSTPSLNTTFVMDLRQ